MVGCEGDVCGPIDSISAPSGGRGARARRGGRLSSWRDTSTLLACGGVPPLRATFGSSTNGGAGDDDDEVKFE